MLCFVRAASVCLAFMVAAAIPAIVQAQSDDQTQQKSRMQEMESKLLEGVRHVGPVPANDEVQVTLVLKHASPAADTSRGQHIEQLTTSQFAERYSARPATLAKISAFAEANHLRIVESDPVKRRVILAGSASAVANAFSTQLHLFSFANGQTYRSPTTPPSVPAALAGDLEAVVGLNTRPFLSPHLVTQRATSAAWRRVETTLIASLYNFPRDVDGAGQTIALLQMGGGFNQEDLDAYFNSARLRLPKITSISVDQASNSPGVDAKSDQEVALDIEVAGSAANDANLVVYFAPNSAQGFINAILDAIHNRQGAPSVISISWGAAEELWPADALTAFHSALQDAAALGITVIAASGDNGSSDGMNDKKLHVDYPASDPFVLGVGGTSVVIENNKLVSEGIWNNGNGSATGGGVSLAFARPAYQEAAKVPPHPTTKFVGRGVPDAAGNADPETGYRIHVKGEDNTVGGTSAVAPLWAGLIARLNQKLGKRLGFINDKLYAMNQGFHLIGSGSNDVEQLGAYAAVSGWNPCIGLGSPDATIILTNLASSVDKRPPALQSTLLVVFGDSTDKVRSVYPVTGKPSNGCGDINPCVTLAAPAVGLMFFFKTADERLYSIRADAPFAGAIEGVHVGDTLTDVTARLGQPDLTLYPWGDTQGYRFNTSDGKLRCYFDESKRCQTIFLDQ